MPLDIDEYMEIGVISRKGTQRTPYGEAYIKGFADTFPWMRNR